jgi:hypothetical protein
MKKFFVILMLVTTLSACDGNNDQSEIQNSVKNYLKDPESAKFKDFIITKNRQFACVTYNAKNSFGGYGEWSIALFEREENGLWQIKDMKFEESPNPYFCTASNFESLNTAHENMKTLLEILK